jgi:hypothetical protein
LENWLQSIFACHHHFMGFRLSLSPVFISLLLSLNAALSAAELGAGENDFQQI